MPARGSIITDEAYLKMLAAAREKANASRKVKSEEKKKIKLAEQLEHQAKVMEAEEKLKQAAAKVSAPTQKADKIVKVDRPSRTKSIRNPSPPASSEDSSEDNSSSESEDETPPPPKPSRRIHRTVAPPVAPPPAPIAPRPQVRAPLTPQQRRTMEAMRSLYI